eukprot:s1806_g6.t1
MRLGDTILALLHAQFCSMPRGRSCASPSAQWPTNWSLYLVKATEWKRRNRSTSERLRLCFPDGETAVPSPVGRRGVKVSLPWLRHSMFRVHAVRSALWSWVRDAADSLTCGFYSWCCDPATHVRHDDVVARACDLDVKPTLTPRRLLGDQVQHFSEAQGGPLSSPRHMGRLQSSPLSPP